MIGYSYLHTALNWQRAHAWFTARGITLRRVITDNGSAYKSLLWRDRRAALPAWLHAYNHRRAHSALGGHPTAGRVPNLSGQNS